MANLNNFKSKIKKLDDYVVLVVVDAKQYQQTNLDLIKYYVNEQKTPGVYITLNKPYETVEKMLKSNKIDPRLIIFIDVITKLGGNPVKKGNCLFIGSPEKLSDLSIAIDQAVNSLPTKNKFLFFDSLNTLLIFNSKEVVQHFMYFLSGKMRGWKVKGVIISLKKDVDEQLIDEITQFCDERIELGGR